MRYCDYSIRRHYLPLGAEKMSSSSSSSPAASPNRLSDLLGLTFEEGKRRREREREGQREREREREREGGGEGGGEREREREGGREELEDSINYLKYLFFFFHSWWRWFSFPFISKQILRWFLSSSFPFINGIQ